MSDKQQQKQDNVSTEVDERPLDPSRNASDLMGDPSGMTGWTTGNAKDTSAEPSGKEPSTDNLPGGIINHPTKTLPTGIPKEAISKKVYDENALKGMSKEKARESEERASDAEIFSSASELVSSPSQKETDTLDKNKLREDEVGQDSSSPDIINTESAPYVNPENVGEQEVSGSTPDPDADADTLAKAQAVGTQLDETADTPQELDVGGDIDKAEEYERTH